MRVVPLNLLVSTALTLYPKFYDPDEPESVVRHAWTLIHNSEKLLGRVEDRRTRTIAWHKSQVERQEYFSKDRTIAWQEGIKSIVDYDAKYCPERFRDFLRAFYGDACRAADHGTELEVLLPIQTKGLDSRTWAGQMDEFYRAKNFTRAEVDFFKETRETYVRYGILPAKGARQETEKQGSGPNSARKPRAKKMTY